MSNGVTALNYAVHFRVIGYYLGQLALMLALLTLVLMAVALSWGELTMAWRYGVVVVLLGLAGLAARALPNPTQIQTNEALVVVVLAFVVAPLLASFPFAAGGLRFADAMFEAVSATTTTGLVYPE